MHFLSTGFPPDEALPRRALTCYDLQGLTPVSAYSLWAFRPTFLLPPFVGGRRSQHGLVHCPLRVTYHCPRSLASGSAYPFFPLCCFLWLSTFAFHSVYLPWSFPKRYSLSLTSTPRLIALSDSARTDKVYFPRAASDSKHETSLLVSDPSSLAFSFCFLLGSRHRTHSRLLHWVSPPLTPHKEAQFVLTPLLLLLSLIE